MSSLPNDPASLARAGADAMRRGEAAQARELFARATALPRADAACWLGLALACGELGDEAAKLQAADRALALEPKNLRALMLKGDHFAQAGDLRTATSFYSAMLRAAPPARQLQPETLAALKHAQTMCARHREQYDARLRERLGATGLLDGRAGRRVAQSLDLMSGTKEIFLQQPMRYYFPGLPQIQFYEREDFPWLGAVEAATADIRGELLDVLNDDRAFSPYVGTGANLPPGDYRGMLNNPDWSAFFMWKDGAAVAANAARCPRTVRALEAAPLDHVERYTPSILFSLLKPGMHIPPHNGLMNTRLICHLPLIVPEGCTLRVGNETRSWVEGETLIFDDSIEHEAWNRSAKLRVVLLFDIWRPELSAEERALVSAIFETIRDYGGEELTRGE
jgi:aspartate beta-hydroxylase